MMQNIHYYSQLNELTLEGVEGKTFLEIGCGPCPIGQKLAAKGARKIYGLDISQEMIDESKANLRRLGIADQFELICADIFDESFALPEKVDCVVLSYTITCFINKRESLVEILRQCSKQIKDDGYILITDFSFPN